MNVAPYYLLDLILKEESPDPFTPVIFDAQSPNGTIPQGFNTVLITVNGRTTSDLNWQKEREAALRYVEQGLRLFWYIDLGMFSDLQSPLTDQAQFLALKLSLEHFKDSLWSEFQEHTVGISFYRGSIEFNRVYPWDEEQNHNFQEWLKEHFQTVSCLGKLIPSCSQVVGFEEIHYSMLEHDVEGNRLLNLFCCDAVTEYFNLLAQQLPDLMPLFHLFDAKSLQDPLLLAHLLSKERYARFARMVTEGVLAINSLKSLSSQNGFLAAAQPVFMKSEAIKVGVCFASFPYANVINEALLKLSANNIPFRIIPEGLLMMEWDELDYLILDLVNISHHGMRQLKGFYAAGGAVISCSSIENLPSPLPFTSFLKWIETYHCD